LSKQKPVPPGTGFFVHILRAAANHENKSGIEQPVGQPVFNPTCEKCHPKNKKMHKFRLFYFVTI
jgi:cytochrome c5